MLPVQLLCSLLAPGDMGIGLSHPGFVSWPCCAKRWVAAPEVRKRTWQSICPVGCAPFEQACSWATSSLASPHASDPEVIRTLVHTCLLGGLHLWAAEPGTVWTSTVTKAEPRPHLEEDVEIPPTDK